MINVNLGFDKPWLSLQLRSKRGAVGMAGVGVFRSLRKSLIQFQYQVGRRRYIAEMRKSAFEGNILRLLRREIQYELQSSPPDQSQLQGITKFDSFKVDGRPGERWIGLKRRFGDEDVKVEATMFDGAAPAPGGDHSPLHITLIVSISKGEGEAGAGALLQFICSAWPDTIEINRLFVRSNNKMMQLQAQPYAGPQFKELDDELQDSLYDFLQVRGINDQLAVFLHHYMKNKDKAEFIRWMEKVKSFIQRK